MNMHYGSLSGTDVRGVYFEYQGGRSSPPTQHGQRTIFICAVLRVTLSVCFSVSPWRSRTGRRSGVDTHPSGDCRVGTYI